MRPTGTLAVEAYPTVWPTTLRLPYALRHSLPSRRLPREVNLWRIRNFPNLWRGLWRVGLARMLGMPIVYGSLYIRVIRADGRVVNFGLASLRVVTDAGVNAIRDAFLNTVELETFKYHGIGTGTNAEATGDTALQTELTTQYVVDNTRPTGTQVSQGTGDYRTVGTIAPDSGGTIAVTEHGIFTQAATGGGTLLDRSKFAAVNIVAAADTFQPTYDFTATSGG